MESISVRKNAIDRASVRMQSHHVPSPVAVRRQSVSMTALIPAMPLTRARKSIHVRQRRSLPVNASTKNRKLDVLRQKLVTAIQRRHWLVTMSVYGFNAMRNWRRHWISILPPIRVIISRIPPRLWKCLEITPSFASNTSASSASLPRMTRRKDSDLSL